MTNASSKADGRLTRFVDWVFGYDYFISYSHGDGLRFPRHLKGRLEKAGFRVFLDQTEYVAGEDLRRETRRQVHKSRKLVIVGRPAALKSAWVKREVDVALADGKIPIIININEAVERAPDDAQLATLARESHWLRLNERLDDPDGEPTDHAVSELVRAFDHTRQDVKRQRILAASAVVFALTAGLATWQAVEAIRARRIAEAQRDRAQRVLDQVVGTANRRVQALSTRVVKQEEIRRVGSITQAPGPGATSSALEQATALLAASTRLLSRSDFNGSRALIDDTIGILEGSNATPAVPQWQLARFKAYHQLAEVAARLGDADAAVAAIGKGIALSEERLREDPAALEWRQRRAILLQKLGQVLLKRGALVDAERSFSDAIAQWQELGGLAAMSLAQRGRAVALGQLGDVKLLSSQRDAAIALYHESAAILEELAASDADNRDLLRDLSNVYQQIGDATLANGKAQDALVWADKDLAVAAKLMPEGGSARQHDLGTSYDRRARALEALGRSTDALKDYKTGIGLIESAIASDESMPSWHRNAAAMLESIGKLLGKVHQPDAAIRSFRKALSIREALAAAHEETDWQLEVEAAYRRASELMLAIDREDEALETAEQYLLATTNAAADGGDSSKLVRIARALGTLCWSAVNAQNFSRAVWAGQHAVELAPRLDWVRLNFAHALMFSGDGDRARAIYIEDLSAAGPNAGKWKTAVLEDFAKLRRRHLNTDLMDEINASFSK